MAEFELEKGDFESAVTFFALSAKSSSRDGDPFSGLCTNDDGYFATGIKALAEAADCLGQMTDAVAGHGDAPHDALTVCELLADWVNRLASGGETGGDTTDDTSDTTSDTTGEPEYETADDATGVPAGEARPGASVPEPLTPMIVASPNRV